MTAAEVSVVVPTHNRPELMARTLASLRAQTLAPERFEVVVVDDGSGPETAALLEREAARMPSLQVLRQEPARGPGAARNRGWRAARGELIAFTDDDCEASSGWLEAYVEAAQAHPGTFFQGRVLPHPEELASYGPFSHTLQIEALSRGFETANMLYPRALLEQLGGFDETAFSKAAGEDTDLGWKAIAAGAQPVWVPDALVHHAVIAAGPVGMLRRATRWDEQVLNYKRHPGLRRTLVLGMFWNRGHWLAARALMALLVPRRFWWVRWWLAAPYVAKLVDRRSGPLLVPYLILRDAIEAATLVRGSLRYRTLVL